MVAAGPGSDPPRKLDLYMQQVRRTPVISRAEEVSLAQRYAQTHERSLEHRLVTANLRFVVKVAHQYRGYGLKLVDLVQEGNLGLLVAVRRFDPSRNCRLVSYAVWWIRAYIQSFIMRNWSMVKVGTTQAQRRLFFRVRSERQRLERGTDFALPDSCIAQALRVRPLDVAQMEQRLSERDHSLDLPLGEATRTALVDVLAGSGDPEDQCLRAQLGRRLQQAIHTLSALLSAKERYIMRQRLLHEEPRTLLEIGEVLQISRERVRQIEGGVIRKLRRLMLGPMTSAA